MLGKMNFRSFSPLDRDPGACLLLILLVLGDLAFIFLHFVNSWISSTNLRMLNLQQDRGYGELFQYLKFMWTCALLVLVARKTKAIHYLAWVPLFVYLLLDDAIEIHEGMGGAMVANWSLVPPFGLRLQDIGELVVSGLAAVVVFPVLLWAYLRGSGTYKIFCRDILVLVLVLAFFGILVDMVNSAVYLGNGIDFVFGALEDGGELVAASLIVWRVFLEHVRHSDAVVAGVALNPPAARGPAGSHRRRTTR